jgi:hypothetical protein
MPHFLAQLTLHELSLFIGATFSGIGALLYGFYKFVSVQDKAERRERQQERIDFAHTLDNVASSNREIAEATKTAAAEAKQRNGHLGEQTEKIAKLILDSKETIISSVQNIHHQHVDEQIVDKEYIKKRSSK